MPERQKLCMHFQHVYVKLRHLLGPDTIGYGNVKICIRETDRHKPVVRKDRTCISVNVCLIHVSPESAREMSPPPPPFGMRKFLE